MTLEQINQFQDLLAEEEKTLRKALRLAGEDDWDTKTPLDLKLYQLERTQRALINLAYHYGVRGDNDNG